MMSSEKTERRIHLSGRVQFEIVREDLERTLRRIYGSEWPKGFEEVIARIVRARVRDAFGLAAPG